MIALVKDWLAGLTHSERLLIAVAGALALVLALTMLVVTPLRVAHADARLDYEAAARLLDEVREGVARAPAQASVSGAASADVRGVATRTALSRGLAISRTSPVEGGLGLRLERADPAALYAWLFELDAGHRVRVERASVRVNDDATVQADIVLTAGGAP